MTSIITRRSLLRGLFATPAIVAASSLMPVRGIIMPIRSPLFVGTEKYLTGVIDDFRLVKDFAQWDAPFGLPYIHWGWLKRGG